MWNFINYRLCYIGSEQKGVPGAVARSIVCPLRTQAVPRSTLASVAFFRGDFPSFADSGRAGCQLLARK